jgi:4'-phosphopantetheinyl transferase
MTMAPERLHFVYSHRGKPALVSGPQQPLKFNVSHSGELALYAIAWRRELGVDIEQIRTDIEFEQIAKRFFSQNEYSTLHALPSTLKAIGFFNCWTRKEAYIKARGEGLALPLDRFDVSLAPGQAAALLHVQDDPQERQRWTLHALPVHPQYAAALAVEGAGGRLRCWRWTLDM